MTLRDVDGGYVTLRVWGWWLCDVEGMGMGVM